MSTNNAPHVPRGPRRDDEYQFVIEGINDRGHGTGFLELHVGPQALHKKYPFAIRGSVVDDVVTARVTNDKRKRREAIVSKVERPSEHRVAPRCPHADVATIPSCGGCAMQTTSYEKQLDLKRAALERHLQNHGVHTNVEFPIGMSDPWNFRNKMEWSFGEKPSGSLGFGLHPPGFRYEVIDHKTCDIAHPKMLQLLPIFETWAAEHKLKAKKKFEEGLISVAMRVNREGDAFCELTASEEIDEGALDGLLEMLPGVGLAFTVVDAERGRPTVTTTKLLNPLPWTETLAVNGQDFSFEVEPGAFFQTNSVQTEVLYDTVINFAKAAVGQDAVVWDLFSGCGTITCALAGTFREVYGIERVEASVRSAQRNATRNGIERIGFHLGDAAEIFRHEDPPDLIVVDPPRAGLGARVIAGLAEIKCELIYVSCNPKTLGPDLKALCAAGRRIESVQPVDMFPHTPHIETVVWLRP